MASRLSGSWISLPASTTDPSGSVGDMYFKSDTDSIRINTSQGWKDVYEAPLGSTSANPASSCRAIVEANADTGDGYYWINAAGTAVQLFCDMTFNPTATGYGRGWTKVAVGCQNTTAAYGTPQPTTVIDQYNYTTEWKLSDIQINSIYTSGSPVWMRGTVVHGSDTSRMVIPNEVWQSNAAMNNSGTMWNGSGWTTVGSCPDGEDNGPSFCANSGWYWSGYNYTSTSGAVSDFRWWYCCWSYHCLFRTTCSDNGPCNGPGAHQTYVYN